MSQDSGADRAAPNKEFLSNYLKGVESGNKRVIARNAARGAQQAVGASGAAALRPSLHKAANKGVSSVRRAVLMSAEQSKHTLCVALLKEVAQVFGYNLAVTVDGEEQEQQQEQDEEQQGLEPLPLSSMSIRLSTSTAQAEGVASGKPAGRSSTGHLAGSLLHHRLQLAAFKSLGLATGISSRSAAAAAAKHRALRNASRTQQQLGRDDDGSSSEYEEGQSEDSEDDDRMAATAAPQQQQLHVQGSKPAVDAAAGQSVGQESIRKGVFSRLGGSTTPASAGTADGAGVKHTVVDTNKAPQSSKSSKAAAANGEAAVGAKASPAAAATGAGSDAVQQKAPCSSKAADGRRAPAAAAGDAPRTRPAAVPAADSTSRKRPAAAITSSTAAANGVRSKGTPIAHSTGSKQQSSACSTQTAAAAAQPKPVAAAALAAVVGSSNKRPRQEVTPQRRVQQLDDHRGLAADDDGWEEVVQDDDDDEILDFGDEEGIYDNDDNGYGDHVLTACQQQQQQGRQQMSASAAATGDNGAKASRTPVPSKAQSVGIQQRSSSAARGNLTDSQQAAADGGEGRVSVLQRLGKR